MWDRYPCFPKCDGTQARLPGPGVLRVGVFNRPSFDFFKQGWSRYLVFVLEWAGSFFFVFQGICPFIVKFIRMKWFTLLLVFL